MFLLDTNVWIEYLKQAPSPVKTRLPGIPQDQIALCDIVKAELFHGAWKSSRSQANLERLRLLFSRFVSFPFDTAAAEVYGRLRADLEPRGAIIGPYDLQIAAIALVHGLVLVTHNTAEFARIDGLRLEDWETA